MIKVSLSHSEACVDTHTCIFTNPLFFNTSCSSSFLPHLTYARRDGKEEGEILRLSRNYIKLYQLIKERKVSADILRVVNFLSTFQLLLNYKHRGVYTNLKSLSSSLTSSVHTHYSPIVARMRHRLLV